MQDDVNYKILHEINEYCKDGKYNVLSLNDISVGYDVKEVRGAIKLLSSNDYISVKYFDQDEICVYPTFKGKKFLADFSEKETPAEQPQNDDSLIRKSFVGSMIGGAVISVLFFLGTVIVFAFK